MRLNPSSPLFTQCLFGFLNLSEIIHLLDMFVECLLYAKPWVGLIIQGQKW